MRLVVEIVSQWLAEGILDPQAAVWFALCRGASLPLTSRSLLLSARRMGFVVDEALERLAIGLGRLTMPIDRVYSRGVAMLSYTDIDSFDFLDSMREMQEEVDSCERAAPLPERLRLVKRTLDGMRSLVREYEATEVRAVELGTLAMAALCDYRRYFDAEWPGPELASASSAGGAPERASLPWL